VFTILQKIPGCADTWTAVKIFWN